MQKGSASPETARWAAQPRRPVGTPPLTPSGAQAQPACAAACLTASRQTAGRAWNGKKASARPRAGHADGFMQGTAERRPHSNSTSPAAIRSRDSCRARMMTGVCTSAANRSESRAGRRSSVSNAASTAGGAHAHWPAQELPSEQLAARKLHVAAHGMPASAAAHPPI